MLPEWLAVEIVLGPPLIAALVWLIRLEGKLHVERVRIDGLKERLIELKELDAAGHRTLQERIEKNGDKMDRLSDQINRLLGAQGQITEG